jgi:hypothetical protein
MSSRVMNCIACILVVACFAYLIIMLSSAMKQARIANYQKYAVMAELVTLTAKKERAMWHCDGYKPRKNYMRFNQLHKHVEGL